MSSRRAGQWLLLGLLLASACADLERGERAADAGMAASPDGGSDADAGDGGAGGLSFTRGVHRVLLDGCRRCHQATGMAGDTGLVLTGDPTIDREVSLKFVNREQPPSSRLLSKASGIGHGGGTVYAAGTDEYETILRWITQGALP